MMNCPDMELSRMQVNVDGRKRKRVGGERVGEREQVVDVEENGRLSAAFAAARFIRTLCGQERATT